MRGLPAAMGFPCLFLCINLSLGRTSVCGGAVIPMTVRLTSRAYGGWIRGNVTSHHINYRICSWFLLFRTSLILAVIIADPLIFGEIWFFVLHTRVFVSLILLSQKYNFHMCSELDSSYSIIVSICLFIVWGVPQSCVGCSGRF